MIASLLDQSLLIVRVKGGLGNQLFQYAAARALSLRTGRSLKIDAQTGFRRDPFRRKVRLDQFSIVASMATEEDIRRARLASLFTWPARRSVEGAYVRKTGRTHVPGLFAGVHNWSYLEGYWQSERYFETYSDLVRRELVVRPEIVRNINPGIGEAAARAVAVHIRRIEYPSLCSLEYYRSAYELISAKIPGAQWYAFGDDHEWIREVLSKVVPCTPLSCEGPDAELQEFWLMSRCRHFVIANSTYSWWAAWLGEKPEAIVVAPRAGWPVSDKPSRALVPSRWKLL